MRSIIRHGLQFASCIDPIIRHVGLYSAVGEDLYIPGLKVFQFEHTDPMIRHGSLFAKCYALGLIEGVMCRINIRVY